MTEKISLKEYTEKLQKLTDENLFDEVVYHSRHILQYLPKNIAAYRYLGNALLQEGHYQEAGEVLRRVLSVFPDDYKTHVSLGEVYQRTKKFDDAIWHYERAYEQTPNQRDLIERIRELYFDHRGVELKKLSLTSGGVARQYQRNRLYDQAIDVLRKDIQKFPERGDLRLLLARILREAERPIQAAEAAQDVLEVLPDSLEANVLLTRVWLAVDRPSDAQRHLTRIEPIDPYLALELAQGSAPPEDAIQLQELDYQRVARQQLESTAPDWLSEIDEDDQQFLVDDKTPAKPKATVPSLDDILGEEEPENAIVPVSDEADSDLNLDDDSWLSDFDDSDNADDLFADLTSDTFTPEPEPSDEISISPPSNEHTGLTGLLSTLDTDDDDETIVDDAPLPEFTDSEDVDFPADLFGESSDEPATDVGMNLFDDDDENLVGDDSDPLAWLQESGIELVDDENDVDTPAPNSDALPASDVADPLAWLQESGVELVDDGTEQSDGFVYEVDELQNPEDVTDPMAWLQESGVELVDDENDESAPVSAIAEENTDDEADPLAWLQESGVELVDDENDQLEPDALFASVDDSPSVPDTSSWLQDDSELLDELLDLEALSTGELTQPEQVEEQDGQDNMLDDNSDNEFSDWFDSDSSDFDSELEWLSDDPDNAGEGLPSNDDAQPVASKAEEDANLDWMQDDATFEDTDDFLTELGTDDVTVTEDDVNELPDWVGETADNLEEAVEPGLFGDTENSFDWDTDESDEDEASVLEETPDWVASTASDLTESDSELNPDDLFGEVDVELDTNDDDMPDWLSESAPIDANIGDSDDSDSPDLETFDWDTEDESSVIEADDAPEWLSAVGGIEDEAEDNLGAVSELADDADEGLDWLSDDAGDEPQDTFEDVVEDAPDWLSSLNNDEDEVEIQGEQLGAVSELADDADDGLDWLSDDADDQLEDTFEDVVEDAPDWLSSLNDEDEVEIQGEQLGAVSELADDADDGLDWLSDDADEQLEDTFKDVVEDAPDWLSSLNDEDEVEIQGEQLGAVSELADDADDGLDWLSDDADDQLEDTFEDVVEDAPDWLSSLNSDEDEVEIQGEQLGAVSELTDDADDGLDWLSDDADDQLEDTFEDVVEDAPDWLSSLNDEDEVEIQGEQLDAVSELADDADETFEELGAIAENDLDWLSDDASDEDAVAETPDWLSDIGDDDLIEDDDALLTPQDNIDEDIVEETPDWLSDVSVDEDEADLEPVASQSVDAEGMIWDDEDDDIDPGFSWEDDETEIIDQEPEWLASIEGDRVQVKENLKPESTIEDGSDFVDEGDIDQAFEDEFVPTAEHDFDDDESILNDVPDWLSAEEENIPDNFIPNDVDEGVLTPDNQFVAMAVDDYSEDDEIDFVPTAEHPFAEDTTEDESLPMEMMAQSAEDEDEISRPLLMFDLLDDDEDFDTRVASAMVDDPTTSSPAIHADTSTYDSYTAVEQSTVSEGEAPPLAETNETTETAFSAYAMTTGSSEAPPLAERPDPEIDVLAFSTMESSQSDLVTNDESGYDVNEDTFAPAPLGLIASTENEEVVPTAAENAPDWLNAMVPGLDVDYDAEEDEQLEQQFVQSLGSHRPVSAQSDTSPQASWLNDIIEDEMSQPATLPESIGIPAKQMSKRRFVFTQLPRWLNAENGQSASESEDDDFDIDSFLTDDDSADDDFGVNSNLDDDFGDTSFLDNDDDDDFSFLDDDDDVDPFDDIGEELPPWLDYDEDEF